MSIARRWPVIAAVLVFAEGCSDSTEPLPPPPPAACPALQACSTVIPTPLEPVSGQFCSLDPRPVTRVRAPTRTFLGASVVDADDCFYRQSNIDNGPIGPYIRFGLFNCCPETRYLRFAVLGPPATRPFLTGATPNVDMATAPALMTYTVDDGVTTLAPACTSTNTQPEGGCGGPEACSGIWTVEIEPGGYFDAGFTYITKQVAPDGFVPRNYSIYVPRASADPNAPPTMPAAVALCADEDPARFGCLDCAGFSRPDRITVDLTSVPGAVESATNMFLVRP